MTIKRFSITLENEIFNFIKVHEEGDNFYLYVLPNQTSKNGFFLTRQPNNGKWQIANRVLVVKEILQIEHKLISVLEERLNTLLAT